MEKPQKPPPNPRRVAAGKRNHALRKGLTAGGRERLRQSAVLHQPWRYSTGPTTEAGKEQIRRNGKRRQKGVMSIRELRAQIGILGALLTHARSVRVAAVD